jgi:hypothetical protein
VAVPVTFNPAAEVNVFPARTSAAVALPKSDNYACASTTVLLACTYPEPIAVP